MWALFLFLGRVKEGTWLGHVWEAYPRRQTEYIFRIYWLQDSLIIDAEPLDRILSLLGI